MKPENYVGKTLGELAEQTHISWRPIHIFLLEDKNDDSGKRLMDAFSFQQVVDAHPAAKNAVVTAATDYNGETVVRILPAKEEVV